MKEWNHPQEHTTYLPVRPAEGRGVRYATQADAGTSIAWRRALPSLGLAPGDYLGNPTRASVLGTIANAQPN